MPLNETFAIDLGNSPTTSDIILKYIRKSIADGSLAEGEPIRQDDVAKMFNVSKIPVREALKRLESEGLVEFHRNRGAVVTSLTEPEIAEIFETRAILESNILRLAVPQLTEATLQKAEAYCQAFGQENDVGRWSTLNWLFHSSLYEDARRPYMVNLVRSINERLERYLRVQLTLSHGHETADREHVAILAACRSRDAATASDLLYTHIMKAGHSLLQHLPHG